MIGRTLGNYRIIEQIGLGGMATVFKGYDPDTDRYVAIKILPQQFSNDPQFRERFQREAKAIAKLEHIHILPIFAYGEEDGISYMVMRYLQSGTLTDRIAEGQLPFAEASQILNQLAGALDHAHSHGILHRDMKPSNVLLDEDGNAYLMDFGIAKILESADDLTGDRLLGTPAYMSPEQCSGEPVGPASDIYSLGIILYEMMTGIRPFHAETPIAVILQQLNDPLPPPREARPDLPEKAENVIFKALAKKPESRYQTASELATAYAHAISEADTAVAVPPPIPAPAIETPTPTNPEIATTAVPTAKHRLPRWAWGIIGLVVIALIIITSIILTNLDNQEGATVETSAALAKETPLASLPQAEEGQIIILEEREENWQIYLQDAHTSANRLLVEIPKTTFTTIGSPRWSPDGQQILFNANAGKDHNDLYTIHIDGTGLTPILQNSEANLVDSAWSPDGQWLAMHASCALWIAHIDGSQITEPVNPNENERCVIYPVWSPDSQQIVFTEQEWELGSTPRLVRVISRNGSSLKTLATIEETTWGANTATWSPDGTQVAFYGSADDGGQAYLINADGSNEAQPIVKIPASWFPDFWPQWSVGESEFIDLPTHEEITQSDEAIMPIAEETVQDDEEIAQADEEMAQADEATARTLCPEAGALLLFDDFTNGNLGNWEFFDVQGLPTNDGWKIIIEEDGNRVLAGTDHNWAQAADTFGENYSLSLRVRQTSNSAFHINFRMSENGRYYMDNNQLARDPDTNSVVQWHYEPDELWHNIRIDAIGNLTEIFWDDNIIASYNDPDPILAGIIALENTNGTVFYDDILLCAISPNTEPDNSDDSLLSAWEIIEPVREQNDFELNGTPSWSPDGQQIAFTALQLGDNHSTDTRIYIFDIDSSELTQLPPAGNSVAPAWSPNGDWLAFHNGCDLASIRPDGTDFYLIWDYTEDNNCVHEPQWSPNSQWLVFATSSVTDQEPPFPRQIRLTSEGGEGEILTEFSVNDAHCDPNQVAFSSDGTQIAYLDGDCHPHLMTLETRATEPIAEFPFWWMAAWHPQWPEFMELGGSSQ